MVNAGMFLTVAEGLVVLIYVVYLVGVAFAAGLGRLKFEWHDWALYFFFILGIFFAVSEYLYPMVQSSWIVPK